MSLNSQAMADRKRYPTGVSDEGWDFVAPYLILFPLEAGQRRHDLREVFNALRYVLRTGCPWRMLPNDLPPFPCASADTALVQGRPFRGHRTRLAHPVALGRRALATSHGG